MTANCTAVMATTTVQTNLVPRAAAQVNEVLWMLRIKVPVLSVQMT